MSDSPPRLELLLVDGHPAIASGITSHLQDSADLHLVTAVDTAVAALAELRRRPIDVVLLELALEDLDGAEAIRLCRAESPAAEILVYTARDDETSVYRALKAGARGYILKSAPLSELVSAIRQVHAGDYVLSPSLSPAIIEFYLGHRDAGNDPLAEYQMLTEREKQVFRLLADGHPTREIGRILCISPKTVAKHRAAIKRKLALKNPVEITRYAMSLGLLDVTDTPETGLKH